MVLTRKETTKEGGFDLCEFVYIVPTVLVSSVSIKAYGKDGGDREKRKARGRWYCKQEFEYHGENVSQKKNLLEKFFLQVLSEE